MRLFRLLLRLRRKPDQQDILIRALKQEATYWRELAMGLQEYIREQNNRLLFKQGVLKAPEPTAPVVQDPTEHESDTEWAARRDREEIDEQAQLCLTDPLRMEVAEEWAETDPRWMAVLDRVRQLQN